MVATILRLAIAVAALMASVDSTFAANPCGTKAERLPAIDPDRLYGWPGVTVEANLSGSRDSTGVYLTPFALGPVEAIVKVTMTAPLSADWPARLIAVGNGRGEVYVAETAPVPVRGAKYQYWSTIATVTSTQLYVGVWGECPNTLGTFCPGVVGPFPQPRICRGAQYSSTATYLLKPAGRSSRPDGNIVIEWEMPAGSIR